MLLCFSESVTEFQMRFGVFFFYYMFFFVLFVFSCLYMFDRDSSTPPIAGDVDEGGGRRGGFSPESSARLAKRAPRRLAHPRPESPDTSGCEMHHRTTPVISCPRGRARRRKLSGTTTPLMNPPPATCQLSSTCSFEIENKVSGQ